MLDWTELEKTLDGVNRVLLTTHVRPDGDALGSELGMSALLKELGKEVDILNASPTPARYSFLDPDGSRVAWITPKDENPAPKNKPDALIVLDTGTWSQLAGLAPYVRTLDAKKVVIDHHVSQDDLGALQLVDSTSAATGMLVFQAYRAMGITIQPEAATALFVAIAMDTGWFRHPNSGPEVYEAAASLVHAGARPHEIYRSLFEQNRPQRLQLMRVLFDRLELRGNGKMVSSYIYWDDIIELGAHPMETEDFINELMTIGGVEVAVLLIGQVDGGTKASFRSRAGFDCSKFAERYGGGGHRAAAGASLKEPVNAVMAKVLPAAEEFLAQS